MVLPFKKQPSNKKVAIVGAGRMGRGIALSFIIQGYTVYLIDIKERTKDEFNKLVDQSAQEIKQQTNLLSETNIISEKAKSTLIDHVHISHLEDDSDEWEQANVLFEAVPEILDVKEDVFKKISARMSEKTLIASTTSSFSANELSSFVTHPERFMNTHWLNPAFLMPLVEVSPSMHTTEEHLTKMFELLEVTGKVPVECKPSPGFIVPRIQALAMNEAASLIEEGVASPDSIDKAIKYGFGPRFTMLGLLEFIDWGGADTLYHASNYLADSLQDNRFAPPGIINEKMESGEIGMKVGKGFYEFNESDLNDYQLKTLKKMIDLFQHLGYITKHSQ